MPDITETTEAPEVIETTETTEAAPLETTEPVETTETPGEETTEAHATETPEEPAYVREMRDQITALQDQLKTRAGNVDQPKAPEPVQPMTEEKWVEFEKSLGFVRSRSEDGQETINVNPRTFAQSQREMLAYVLAEAKKYADEQVHGNTSEIKFNAVLEQLSAKTPDVKNYSKAIQEYLSKRYQAKDRSNPEFMMDGYWWAKAQNRSNTPKPAGGPPPKRRIVSPARPGGNGNANNKPVALTAFERQQIKEGFFKDEAELLAYKRKNLSI